MTLQSDSNVTMDSCKSNEIKKPAVSKSAKTYEVNYSTVDFIRHVLPYYAPCFMLIGQHVVYFTCNGNFWLILLVAYAINFPYFKGKATIPRQESNLDRSTEKLFKEDQRFMGPLYLYVLLDCLSWLWCLCVVSR